MMQHKHPSGKDRGRPWPPPGDESRDGANDSPCRFHARAFGDRAGDLDVDFQAPPPVTVTQLLTACVREADGRELTTEDAWQLSLNDRLQGLLAVNAATRGLNLVLEMRCERDECGEFIQLPLRLDAFARRTPPAVFTCRVNGNELRIKTPTGADQLAWIGTLTDDDEVAASMADALIESIDGRPAGAEKIRPEWLNTIGEALETQDELTALELHTQCPACEQTYRLPLNLEQRLLSRLADCQHELMDQVCILASVFHWSETDILSLPPARRRFYLHRIETGACP